MAEPGVSHQLEGKVFRLILQYAAVELTDAEDQRPDQLLKRCVCRFVFGFMRVIPFPIIVLA